MSSADLITRVTNGSRPLATTLTAAHIAATTTAVCGALTGWPTTPAGVHFAIYKKDTSGVKVAGSQTDWEGIVSGTSLINLVLKAGTDNGYAIGDTVECMPTAAWADGLAQGILAQHAVDGTHTAITATSLNATSTINASTQGNLQDGSIALQTMRSENTFDYVASGCVITADSVGVNKNYSMTAGVVYIGGKRVVVNAVSAQTVTASNDRYIDVDNTGTLTTTSKEVANNAASPALAASSIRLGIVVAGATTIAATTSINQGQEDRILPISGGTAYSVTDSLGNLICPRDSNRKLLGLRQVTATQGSITIAVDAVGLFVPVIIPTGRKVKVSYYCQSSSSTVADSTIQFDLKEGTTFIETGVQSLARIDSGINATYISRTYTPTTTSIIYKVTYTRGVGSGTLAVAGSATAPAYLMVELV